METTSYEKRFEEIGKTIVAFHVGLSPVWRKPNYIEYDPYISSLQDCYDDSMIISTDEDGNELPHEQWVLVDSGGNVKLKGYEAINSPCGSLRWDGVYNTDIVKRLQDCTPSELSAIIRAHEKGIDVEEEIALYAIHNIG